MVADSPLKVTLPNGNIVQSSHITELDLPQLPRVGRAAHIIPGLESHSLVSFVKLFNSGCEVDVKDTWCEIWHQGETIVRCSKDLRTSLCMMPLAKNVEGNDASLNERKTTTTPELVLAGISHHIDPTLQTVTTTESDWTSSVRQWK